MDYYMICLRLLYLVTGCCAGSFLCVCAYRLPRDMSLISPGSQCDHCGHPLQAMDLVPVISYLLSRGRCRYCHKPVPARYFWRELETGLLFLALGWQEIPGVALAARFLLASTLLLTSWLDEEEHMIYQVVLLVFGAAILLHHFALGTAFWQPVAGALAVGCFLGLLHVLQKKGMGLGDIELGALLGLWLGPVKGLGCVFLAAFLALLYVLGRARCGDAAAYRRPVPFSPFLVISALGLGFFWDTLSCSGLLEPGLCLFSIGSLEDVSHRLCSRLKAWRPFQPKELLVLRLEAGMLQLSEIKQQENTYLIVRQAGLHLADGSFPYETANAEAVAAELQELCSRKGFRARAVVISLPWQEGVLRSVRLPGLKKKERLEAARWEVLQDIPYETGTFRLAAVPVTEAAGDVAAAALPDEVLSFYRQLSLHLGWQLLSLVPDVTAWGRWLSREPEAFCLSGSRQRPVLTAFRQGCPVRTAAVNREPEKTGEQLEKSPLWQEKREPCEKGARGMLENAEALCKEWTESLGWQPAVPVHVFAPGCWELESFKAFDRPVKWLHGETKVRPADYFVTGDLPDAALWPGMWGAILPAAACPGPVFSPGTLKERWQLWGPGVGCLTAAVTVALYLLALGYQKAALWQWQASNRPDSQLQAWTECWQDWLKQDQDIRSRSKAVSAEEDKRLSWAGFFMLLGRLVPADCWVTRITQEKPDKGVTKLHVAGRTLHKHSALQLVQRLKQHPMVSGVRLEKLQQEDKADTAGFAIFLQLKGGPSYES